MYFNFSFKCACGHASHPWVSYESSYWLALFETFYLDLHDSYLLTLMPSSERFTSTARQQSCRKVMLPVVSVCSQGSHVTITHDELETTV